MLKKSEGKYYNSTGSSIQVKTAEQIAIEGATKKANSKATGSKAGSNQYVDVYNALTKLSKGEITAAEAKTIFEKAGLKAPKAVESLLSKEQPTISEKIPELNAEEIRKKLQEIEKQPVKINITQDINGKMEQTSQEVIANIKTELDKTGLPYSDVVSNDKGSTYFVITKDGQQHEILKVLQSGGKLVPTNLTKAKWINHLIKTEKESVINSIKSETIPELKDVESTAKALEKFQEYQQNELYNLTPSIYFGKDGKYGLESVAEAYHADKATGKETELTKAVEELLGKPKEEVKPTETEPIKLTEEQKQKAKETVDEIKKINLTHVEGTGMGSEQADGMYISTEKGGNRYATKDRPAKQVEVEIENPKVTTYEENKSLQKETTSELIEKEALGLEDVETQYWDGIKKHSGKGLSDITPKDVTNWFNSIKDKFKKETYEEYLKESGKLKVAKSITEKLKSEGYDALYIPESKNIEGELIVFDRSKVKEKGKEPSKVEPVKKSVIGIKPPKVEGDKITTISGKTEQERLDSIEKRKKETTVTEKVKAENDLWQDAQSLFSKNKNRI